MSEKNSSVPDKDNIPTDTTPQQGWEQSNSQQNEPNVRHRKSESGAVDSDRDVVTNIKDASYAEIAPKSVPKTTPDEPIAS